MSHFSDQLSRHLDHINATLPQGRAKRITAYRVALEVGLDPSFLTNIFHGRKRGSADTLRRLSKSQLLGLSYEQLRAWQAQDSFEPEALRAASHEDGPMTDGATMVGPPDTMARIPCLGVVTAGGIRLHRPDEDPSYFEWWDLSRIPNPETLVCFRVQGLSMWPPVPDGSMLLVRPVEVPDGLRPNGWYVVVTQQDEATFKLVALTADRMTLQPLNPAFAQQTVPVARVKQAWEVLKYQVSRL